MRACALVALLALPLCAATAADVGLEPIPRLQPLVPMPAEAVASGSEQDELIRRLSNLIHNADNRIGVIQGEMGTSRPPAMPETPALREPREQRDQAWKNFQEAMKAFITRVRSANPDPIAIADPVAKEQRRPAIAYANRLSIVECYKDLIINAQGTAEDLAAGVRTLTDIDVAQLSETEKPRLSYLKIWFLAEQARSSTGDQRAKFLTQARQAQREFIQQYPMSSLAATAQVLLLDFDAAGEASPTDQKL